MILQTCCRRIATARPLVMPLRAKILSPAMANTSIRLSSSIPLTEQPGDEPNDVLFNTSFGLRTVNLNRPKKLNSLNGSMARKIVPRLQEWTKSDMANVVVLKGEGRALCAGGDVAWLALRNKEGPKGQQQSKDYFALEYKLDHLISTYTKPYVAFMDGITMGGGVGLSLHAPFRIATENTVFAMPETTIGFFPDVGASFFLPRLDGELGMYLALTSEQLKGVDAFYAGIATHYLHSSSLPDLEARLSELQFNDNDSMQHRLQIINSTIEEFSTGVPQETQIRDSVIGGNIRQGIDYVFQPGNNIEGVLAALEGLSNSESGSAPAEVATWAAKTRKTILQRSPTSVKVTMKQLRDGATWSIAETFRREHSIASKFMEHPDFIEGVSALLIDKPKRTPNWTPASLQEVSDASVNEFFSGRPTLELLSTNDYKDYPHAWIGLPRERDVQSTVGKSDMSTRTAVVKHFIKATNGKQGVKEKVGEILERKTIETENGLNWKR
ncbi:Hypothetical protein R9X50_00233000 [Acrodontium crateriforme]|uniref:3-hydroxyisobutyryl-CoA hydrolase n=1 Tax=Acrodontium crateriforme TaxID=150365 RepID=A0AAQ3M427_9PEZI|nr:Hypothetical protein R9X50_00233000 [Acrodontium crateriforme]